MLRIYKIISILIGLNFAVVLPDQYSLNYNDVIIGRFNWYKILTMGNTLSKTKVYF